MPRRAASRVVLAGGAYKARSLTANAQRSINLYLEANPKESQPPFPFTLYPRPGLRRLATPPTPGIGRGLYQDSQGNLYCVVGNVVYYVDPNFHLTAVGAIAPGTSICSMADNGTTMILVDGTPAGYTIDVQSKVMAPIVDAAFYGGDRVDYVRTVFALNRPGTKQFYISGVNAATWNPLDFGEKTSSADPLIAAVAFNDGLWLLGNRRGEAWYYSGDALFPFQQQAGVLIEHGCVAKYSVATTDKALFWLTQDKDGKPWVARGSTDYAVVKVSTFAMDDEIRKYVKWSDAVGYCYQQLGHTFYQLDFPAADKSWVLDLSNGEWAQYSSIDINGVHHRHKGFLSAYAYNTNVMLDWQNGKLYAQDPDTFTDDSLPIVCIRGIPHLGGAGNLISYPGIIADFDAGNIAGVTSQAGNPWSAGFSSAFGPFFQPDTNEPLVRMRFSATRGNTFGNPRQRSLGATGQYNRILKWDSCGSARDGVFEFEWAVPAKTSLNGVFLSPPPESAET
jgi:hypothetical protein